jgi:hypothetical protein
MQADGGYLAATRHPWPCLLFLLPLLLAYEAGVVWLGGTQPDTLRNGADTWLRWGLHSFGLGQLYGLPVLLLVLFFTWAWLRRQDRPPDLAGLWLGMALESVALALLLWGLCRGLRPTLDGLGIALSWTPPQPGVLGDVVSFVGAGIYEEVLFRLLLFSGLFGLLRLALAPWLLAFVVASVGSAVLFAAAHHLGPFGEEFDGYVFLFRSLAGLYFAVLYQLRGFGVAVGTHACYDVLVGVVV